MAPARIQPFPPQAVEWLTGRDRRVLVIGPSAGIARMLAQLGHEVFLVDRSLVALARAAGDPPLGTPVAAAAEALPFAPCQFDVVLAAQNLHTFAPGLALAEIGRVLRPTGQLAVVYTARDDSVPWVKRLAAILRQVDPGAMKGDYGMESVAFLDDSRYFPAVEEASFRTWFPVTRPELLAMVSKRRAFSSVDDATRDRLLTDVGALYDSVARAPEPLLLPYRALCWRASVNQDELSVPISLDDGLRIF